MITRTGENLEVTLWTDSWHRIITIRNDQGEEFRLFGTTQLRALHFMLGEVLAADPSPDDRPRP